jgi:hypothetical protein
MKPSWFGDGGISRSKDPDRGVSQFRLSPIRIQG